MYRTLAFILLYALVPRSTIAQPLDFILHDLDQHASIGAIIIDSGSGDILYQKNPHRYLIPASTLKLLTAIAATDKLHRQEPFTTKLKLYGKQEGATFKGDVVISPTGDPSLKIEKLKNLLTKIAQRKITQIDGNVYIQTKHFDKNSHIPGTVWEEQNDCYCSPASALSLEENCYTIALERTEKGINIHNTLEQEPIVGDISVKPSCQDHKTPSIHHTIYGKGYKIDHAPYQKPHVLTGCWAKHAAMEQKLKLSVQNPQQLFQSSVTNILDQLNIQSPKPKLIHRYQSHMQPSMKTYIASDNLPAMMQKLLKTSNNHIANQCFKHLGAITSHQPGSWEQGENAIQDTLSSYNIEDRNASIVDGAGLSRNNRLQAKTLADALQVIYHTPKLQNLITALPCAGLDGTLRNRLRKNRIPICAKTGFLNGVVTLAGYIDPFGKKPKTFVLMLNGNKTIHKDYEAIEDAIFAAIEKL